MRTFEYGVILNGSQTNNGDARMQVPFEYGVILNGSQTSLLICAFQPGLSMVLF